MRFFIALVILALVCSQTSAWYVRRAAACPSLKAFHRSVMDCSKDFKAAGTSDIGKLCRLATTKGKPCHTVLSVYENKCNYGNDKVHAHLKQSSQQVQKVCKPKY